LRKKCEHEALHGGGSSQKRKTQEKKSHFSAFPVDGSVELMAVSWRKTALTNTITAASIRVEFQPTFSTAGVKTIE
jgi:hypothetical protein